MSTTIQEAASAYILEGSAKVKKWGKTLTEVNKQLAKASKPVLNMEGQTALAKLLENTQNRINYELRESTQNTMVGPYKKYAMDIIAGMVPNLIAMDVVSVQPLENKQGIINYVEFQAGSDKAGYARDGQTLVEVKKGDLISSTYEYQGAGTSEGYTDYSAGRGSAEPVVTTLVADGGKYFVPWTPLWTDEAAIAATQFKVSTDVYTIDADGKVYKNDALDADSSIDITTGELVLDGVSDDVTAEYFFNNEYAPVMVPEIDLAIKSELVLAKSRKLKALWSFDAQYELQKDYGQDIGALLAAQAAGEIAHEIDTEICLDLTFGAGSTVSAWDAATPYGVSQAQHFESFKTALNRASRQIYQKTKRALGNFVICGTNVATVIESTPSFVANSLGNTVGPYLLGTWGAYKVYVNPFLPTNQFVVGFKGDNLFEAGYVYAPYLPVATTQMLMLADFQGQQGWATSYGKKMLQNKFYCAGSITNFG